MPPEQYIPLIVLAVMLPLIFLRNRKPRVLRPQWMWVMPALIVPLMGFAMWGQSMAPGVAHTPFAPIDWALMTLGLLLGGVAGWWRGRMMTIHKGADGALLAQASPVGLLLIVGLLLARRGLVAVIEPHAASWGLNPLAVADAFLVFVMGMIVVQRLEMFIRARRVAAGGADAHVEAAV